MRLSEVAAAGQASTTSFASNAMLAWRMAGGSRTTNHRVTAPRAAPHPILVAPIVAVLRWTGWDAGRPPVASEALAV